jgi:NAD(P)-dependent dehydrogenase (short-subunit alcohol dehydrogenase family)
MGINVNAIAPAVARTVMTEDSLTPELQVRIKARIPMGRLGEASDVACLAAFLPSAISEFISGETLVVDGGFLTG